jgi:hypothetical protein
MPGTCSQCRNVIIIESVVMLVSEGTAFTICAVPCGLSLLATVRCYRTLAHLELATSPWSDAW